MNFFLILLIRDKKIKLARSRKISTKRVCSWIQTVWYDMIH